MNPLPLTIISPNYNHAHFLPMAIESVLGQSFADFEFLIVDDGSTDHSIEVIKRYIRQDRRIKLLCHQHNRGIIAAVQTAMDHAGGEYLHFLSISDCYLPQFLEKSMSQLLKHKEIGLCCTDTGLFNEDPSIFTRTQLIEGVRADRTFLFEPKNMIDVFKYGRFIIPGLSAIIKKSSYIKYGGYSPALHFMCDGYLNQQIALFEGALYISETLIVYREPEYSKTSSSHPVIRQQALDGLLNILLQSENRELLRRMKKAALLGILGKERILDIIKHPSLWSLYIHLAQRYVLNRKKFLCVPKHVVASL